MNISRFKDGLEELISNYSIDRYGRDWDYCFGLSFKYEVKNFNNCIRFNFFWHSSFFDYTIYL